MANVVTEVARFLIILLIAIYTYYNFRYYSYTYEEDRDYVVRNQVISIFLILTLADTVMWLRTENVSSMMLAAAQALFIGGYLLVSKLIYRRSSRLLSTNMCMLMATSFVVLNRISVSRSMRQFVIVAAAAAVTLVIPVMIEHIWQLARIPWVYAIGGMLLLLAVRVIGTASFGAQLSLNVGGFSFQPSEFVKLTFVFFVATMFERSTSFEGILRTSAVAALHVLILVFSKDLGSALIFFVAYVFMLFVASSNWVYLASGFGSGTLAAIGAYSLFRHVRVRVEAWKDPFADISGSGYQVAQGLFAIGTGGWFGMGLYQGMPNKIPVVEKDFIFAAISEELGGIYGVCIILICVGCFMQFMKLAMRMEAVFYRMIALGLGVIYITQVFLTIGGVTKFIPSTGVTLPFVSYGGSSILSSFIMFSVIQGLYIMKARDEEEMDEQARYGGAYRSDKRTGRGTGMQEVNRRIGRGAGTQEVNRRTGRGTGTQDVNRRNGRKKEVPAEDEEEYYEDL